ncbi:hypothetical protein HDU98_006608 [Podochytrium sp. JEL0797]|nr:hypothetical protein HDU98_006608 [Podochytrium sp. JEL0797]
MTMNTTLANDGTPAVPLRDDGRRKRVHPSREQTLALEECFRRTRKPSAQERVAIAKSVGINQRSIQIWFQNRRAREKKESADLSPQSLHHPSRPISESATPSQTTSPTTSTAPPLPPSPIYPPPTRTQIHITELHIGSWRRVSLTPTDLTCHVDPSTNTLHYAVTESGYLFECVFPLTAIQDMSLHPVVSSAHHSTLLLTILPGTIPHFLRNQGPSPSSSHHENVWTRIQDFTESLQASSGAPHVLQGTCADMDIAFQLVSEYFEGLKRRREVQHQQMAYPGHAHSGQVQEGQELHQQEYQQQQHPGQAHSEHVQPVHEAGVDWRREEDVKGQLGALLDVVSAAAAEGGV